MKLERRKEGRKEGIRDKYNYKSREMVGGIKVKKMHKTLSIEFQSLNEMFSSSEKCNTE